MTHVTKCEKDNTNTHIQLTQHQKEHGTNVQYMASLATVRYQDDVQFFYIECTLHVHERYKLLYITCSCVVPWFGDECGFHRH